MRIDVRTYFDCRTRVYFPYRSAADSPTPERRHPDSPLMHGMYGSKLHRVLILEPTKKVETGRVHLPGDSFPLIKSSYFSIIVCGYVMRCCYIIPRSCSETNRVKGF